MERVILATLHYAAATDTPLTAVQVWRRLVHPHRIDSEESPSLSETMDILGELAVSGRVQEKNGWYLPGDAPTELFGQRMEQMNINADKWRRMLSYAWWLQVVPFVRALAASGSLASGTTGKESDWDMFVIARKGRLYTARLGLLLVSQFMGVLRVKEHRVATDLFCFNHYVTDDGLGMRHQSLYVAHAISDLIPICDPDGFIGKLKAQNAWMGDYLARTVAGSSHVRREVKHSRVLSAIRRSLEVMSDITVGWAIEAVLRWWQQWRIALVPATYEAGGRVVADEQEIEFHPRSSERAILARYNDSLSVLGISRREEDSGLTT